MEDVLAEVECDQSFARILPVRVDTKSDCRRAAQRTAEADDSEADGRAGMAIMYLVTRYIWVR